jgi:hypothetical protein
MKAFSLKNCFAAAGLAVLASAPVAQAGDYCGHRQPSDIVSYDADDLGALANHDKETLRSLTAEIARGAVEHAFDGRARKDAFLQQSKHALLAMVKRLPKADTAERIGIHDAAYKLRLTLEARNFAYHYAMAAQAVAMAADTFSQPGSYESEDKDQRALERTIDALDSTTLYDLGRVTKADLRKPLEDARKKAEALNMDCRWWDNKYMLLDTIGREKAFRHEQAVIAKAVDHLKLK